MYLKYGKKGYFIKDYPDKEIKIVDICYVIIDTSIVYMGPKEGYHLS